MDNRLKSIPINRPFPLPQVVVSALQELHRAGFTALVVGGSVRDFLLGRPTKDHDIATDALPDEICRLFPKALTVGKAFGVIKVPTGMVPPVIEIATFRRDLTYQDHRHPSGVEFTGPEEDAQRRDFTINGLFYDFFQNQILDYCGGFDDLKAGVIRAIGHPEERFQEDALRLVRAVRFSSRFSFRVDPGTLHAMKKQAALISHISVERIRDELTWMWTGSHPNEALHLLSRCDLLPWTLPEVDQEMQKRGGVQSWIQRLRVLETLYPQRSVALSWAALLILLAQPQLRACTTRLKFSNRDAQRIEEIIAGVLEIEDLFQKREALLQRFLRQESFDECLALYHCWVVFEGRKISTLQKLQQLRAELHLKKQQAIPRLVSGEDLMALGFQPGPKFREILTEVENLALEGKLLTRQQALDWMTQYWIKKQS